jgi:NAD(P)-dependent dehydrogenase (short-subunit alcohol dehydrogenase family)
MSVSRALRGSNVVITGGNRGIGLQFVKQFLSKGNNVVATTRNIEKSHELNRLAGESAGKLTIATLDVGDKDSITRFPSSIPFDHVDVLINNAGIAVRTSLDDVNAEAMLSTFSINTIGPLLVTQQVLKSGKIGGAQSSIVANVTSKMGSIADNGSGGSYAYRASKCALNIVTKSLSIDMKPRNIDTILLHPGWVKTDMTGQNGLIDDVTSVKGMISVLEEQPELNGKFFDYKQEAIPW